MLNLKSEKYKVNNVLITGGAGFIGSHIVDELTKHDVSLIVIVDNLFLGTESNLRKSLKTGKVKLVKGDVTNYKELQKIFDKYVPDLTFHLAVIPLPTSLVRPKWTFEQNIKMVENILELVRLGKTKYLVNFSSSEVYGTAQYTPIDEKHPLQGHTPYAASKIAADALVWSYVKTFGVKALTIRPFNNYGPRQNDKKYAAIIPLTVKRILDGQKPIINGDGKQTRDFVYAKDNAKLTIDLISKAPFNGDIYNLCTGKEVSIKDLVQTISRLLNYNGKIEYNRLGRKGDVERLIGSNKKLKKLLKPSFTPFEKGMKETIEWYKGFYK